METLPGEVLEQVTHQLSYADRMTLHLAQPQMPYPMLEFADKYLPCEWSEFSEQLRRTESTIGGSTALKFFSYATYEPGDVDIYGPISSFPSWQRFLERHGFIENKAQRAMIYYRLPNHVNKFEFHRGPLIVQYIYGRRADDVDNTANRCTMSHNEAICPHYDHVEHNHTVFSVEDSRRIAKMIARGFRVDMKPQAPPSEAPSTTWKGWLLSIFSRAKKVQEPSNERRILLT